MAPDPDDLRPLAEATPAGLRDAWAVVYACPPATPDAPPAVDVLLYDARRTGLAVDLGPCLFSGRLRGGRWVSRVGVLPGQTLRALTSWAMSAASR